MIAIVDYGMGNLRSVQKAFERTGLNAQVTNIPETIKKADALVLPGVGAFRDCMANLAHLELEDTVKSFIKTGKPYFGICLGLQILLTSSEEFGISKGLDIIKGSVVEFNKNMPDPQSGEIMKIPHMGWNTLENMKQSPLFDGIKDGEYFYFVHSFYIKPSDMAYASSTTGYGIEFVSSIWKDNIVATQFHPEKSQTAGLKIIENFGKWIKKC